jgi:hypothetical protein
VTTLAVALGARWPAQENPIVVEADPAGGGLMARFRLPDSPGLVSLAAAARRSTDATVLFQHAQPLPGGLRAVLGPVGTEQSRAVLSALTNSGASVLRRAADLPDTIVIADCGRVDPDSPALPIIRAADAMLLVARPRDDELAHVSVKLQTAQRWSRKPCFMLIGDGYPTREVSHVLGIPVMGRVPHDERGAALLGGRRAGLRGSERSALGRAAARIALLTSAQVHADNGSQVPQGMQPAPMLVRDRAAGASTPQLAPQTRNGVGS